MAARGCSGRVGSALAGSARGGFVVDRRLGGNALRLRYARWQPRRSWKLAGGPVGRTDSRARLGGSSVVLVRRLAGGDWLGRTGGAVGGSAGNSASSLGADGSGGGAMVSGTEAARPRRRHLAARCGTAPGRRTGAAVRGRASCASLPARLGAAAVWFQRRCPRRPRRRLPAARRARREARRAGPLRPRPRVKAARRARCRGMPDGRAARRARAAVRAPGSSARGARRPSAGERPRRCASVRAGGSVEGRPCVAVADDGGGTCDGDPGRRRQAQRDFARRADGPRNGRASARLRREPRVALPTPWERSRARSRVR